jgi:hypothetical protein
MAFDALPSGTRILRLVSYRSRIRVRESIEEAQMNIYLRYLRIM